MEWIDKMNDAIKYIEAHIEEKINFTEVAKTACCSLSRFQKMFTFVTDITVSEYVRYRRMSLAVHDLLNSDIKIVDLASKYCYESRKHLQEHFNLFMELVQLVSESLAYTIIIHQSHFN